MRIVIPVERPRHEMPLKDGSVVTLSPILKTDREFFEQGVSELSLESRFLRFGQGISSLSRAELDYLTDVDQRRHVAWGAAIEEEVAGVGRYIVSHDGDRAEVAVTVLDAMQRRGVGRALFQALTAVARADGIHEFCFEAQADNEAVMSLVRNFEISPLVSDGVIERRIRISSIPEGEHDDDLVAVIAEVRGQA
ncbi:MAG TPA: GNAT family N-acetyltransferase [Acidimicrobiia bacterium]|nr:GNAT family N-acetyltransferase [Acidimicrobiia bacterium]